MPIYAYACSSCGAQKDVMQKMSDAPLSTCPECGKETFAKQLTAAGFQLKGNGYYATDFRSSGAKPAAKPDAGGAEAKPAPAAKADAPAAKPDAPTPASGAAG